jgi:hypothetical protein
MNPNSIATSPLDPDLVKLNQQLRAILFKASIRSYSSLNFDVEIAGVQALAEIFGADLQLFQMFLEAYVPLAFQSAMHDWDFDCTSAVTLPASTAQAFKLADKNASTAGQAEAASSSGPRGRAAWIWILSNTSLVVPVALALLVLYVQMKSLEEQRTALNQRISELQKREEAAQRTFAEQHKLISEYTLEVARILKPQPSKR